MPPIRRLRYLCSCHWKRCTVHGLYSLLPLLASYTPNTSLFTLHSPLPCILVPLPPSSHELFTLACVVSVSSYFFFLLLSYCTSGSSSHTHTHTHPLNTHIIHTLGELISGSFVVGQLPVEAVAEAELRLSCLGSCLMRYQNFCFITLVSRRTGGVTGAGRGEWQGVRERESAGCGGK